jgi:4-hydroxy-tetrahydrodipicolinate synthase
MAARFTGSIVALVTPMNASGELDWPAFDRLIDWHLAQGSDGFVICGTTGESPTLSGAESAELVAHAVVRVAGRVPVIAGAGTNSTQTSVERARRLAEAGADAMLVVTPYYNRPTQEGLARHFEAVADASPVPVILYNVPGRTAVDLLPETVIRLAAHPRIVAIKEASASVPRVRELMARRPAQFTVLSGDDAIAAEAMLAGAVGVISVTANVAPRLMHELCAAAARQDVAGVRELDARLAPLHRALFVEPNPIPVKWALLQLGRIGAGIRLPLTTLSPGAHAVVRDALQTTEVSCAA